MAEVLLFPDRTHTPMRKRVPSLSVTSLAQAKKKYTNLDTTTSVYIEGYETLHKTCMHLLGERRKGKKYPEEQARQMATDFRNRSTNIGFRLFKLKKKDRAADFVAIRIKATALVNLLERVLLSEITYTLTMEQQLFVPIENTLNELGDYVYALL